MTLTPREQVIAAFSDALDALDEMRKPLARAFAVLVQVRASVLDREIGFTDEHFADLIAQADAEQAQANTQAETPRE